MALDSHDTNGRNLSHTVCGAERTLSITLWLHSQANLDCWKGQMVAQSNVDMTMPYTHNSHRAREARAQFIERFLLNGGAVADVEEQDVEEQDVEEQDDDCGCQCGCSKLERNAQVL